MRIGVLLPQVKGPRHAGEWPGQAGSPRAGGRAALLASGAARQTRGVSGGHGQGGHGCVPGDQAPPPPSGALRPSSPGGHVPRIPNLWASSWTREPRGAPRGRRLRLVWPSGRGEGRGRAGSEGTTEANEAGPQRGPWACPAPQLHAHSRAGHTLVHTCDVQAAFRLALPTWRQAGSHPPGAGL